MTTDDKLNQLLQDVATVKADVATVKAGVEHLDATLYRGNGKPSLLARVEVIESGVKDLTWLKRTVIGAFLTGLAGLIFAIL